MKQYGITTTTYHTDVIPVQQYLRQFCVLSAVVKLGHVLQHHVHIVVKAEKCAAELCKEARLAWSLLVLSAFREAVCRSVGCS